jgi:NCAIR mutase (PurE)-related protein
LNVLYKSRAIKIRLSRLDKDKVIKLLKDLSQGQISLDSAYAELQDLPFKDLGFARLDTHRAMRQGMPEVIYCPGKTAEQIIDIAKALTKKHNIIVGTKCDSETAAAIKKALPKVKYYREGKILLWGQMPKKAKYDFAVTVITAGTADMPIAEEAAIYLQAAGVLVKRLNDVGIAGLHRLVEQLPNLKKSNVCIVVAGMDGALPGVVGGLIGTPVIAVPTSVGYGASFSGIAPLLTMLNSCAAGVTVVNIDNGFGAAVAALRILQLSENKLEKRKEIKQ